MSSTDQPFRLTCPSCDGEIEPGQKRYPTEEGAKHGYCILHESLFDKYYFSILNPIDEEGYSIALWRIYEDENEEFPVLNYSEDIMTVNSSSILYSAVKGIEPTEEFFTTIAYTVHSIMSFNPIPTPFGMGGIDKDKIQDEVDRHIDIFYDHKPPDHEVRFIEGAVAQILPHTFNYVIEELKPIRDFAQECTTFNLPDVHPALVKDNDN